MDPSSSGIGPECLEFRNLGFQCINLSLHFILLRECLVLFADQLGLLQFELLVSSRAQEVFVITLTLSYREMSSPSITLSGLPGLAMGSSPGRSGRQTIVRWSSVAVGILSLFWALPAARATRGRGQGGSRARYKGR